MNIYFSYEGKNYVVGQEAYEINRIVLPDGRVLEATAWLETSPPQPENFTEVNHLFINLTPEEISEQMNGVLAYEV